MECNTTYICPELVVPAQNPWGRLFKKIESFLSSISIEGAEHMSKIK